MLTHIFYLSKGDNNMTQIISKARYDFTQDVIETSPNGNTRRIAAQFMVALSHLPQEVPRWVEASEFFTVLLKENSIQIWTPPAAS